MNRGIWYGIAAYGLWGFFPVYWKLLQDVPASESLVHRMIWSLVFLLGVLAWRKQWQWLGALRSNPRSIGPLVLAGSLLAVNWYTFIWAVNHGFVVESSLGYFITPLLSVALGVVLLGERLRRAQWLAVGLAAAGVLYLTFGYGEVPRIALILAFSFGLYGYIKKRVRLHPFESLAAEMAALFLPASGYLFFLLGRQQAVFGYGGLPMSLLLVSTGVVTAIPLLLFAGAAQRIPLSVLGLLQYIAPTLHFLLGVFLYHEPFTTQRLLGFAAVWLALLVFTADNLRTNWPHLRALRRPGR